MQRKQRGTDKVGGGGAQRGQSVKTEYGRGFKANGQSKSNVRGGWLRSFCQQTACPSTQQNNTSQPERHPVNLERHPDYGL